jgi:hypothetical protein
MWTALRSEKTLLPREIRVTEYLLDAWIRGPDQVVPQYVPNPANA